LLLSIEATLKRFRRWPLLYYWLPLIVWMGIIFWFSAQPEPFAMSESWQQELVGNAGHAIGYAGLGLLWWRALAALPVCSRRWTLALAFLFTTLYAISDEYHQTFVPGRSGNLVDLLVDTAGAGLALWLLHRWQAGHATRSD
jgi:hypothetical protein